MNIVHSIQLRDTGIFKDVRFSVPKGLSVVYGLNRSGGPHSKNSNGVGKSAMFSALSEMLYEEPIVGEKQDRLKAGTRAFSFTSAVTKKKTAVVRSMKGRSEKVNISVDGKDKEFRTPTIAKNYLKKAWPITQEEYNTYVHLDSRVPHPLVMGTTTQRKQFFTSFFGLDRLDAERKLFSAELNKLAKTKVAFQELRAQYNKSKEDLLSPEDLEKYKAKAKSYKAKLEVLQEEFKRIQETVRLIQFAQSAKEQIKTLGVACGGSISEEEFERAVKDNAWELKKVRQDLDEAEQWEQYKRDNAHYVEAYSALSEDTRKAIKEHGKEVRRVASAKSKELREARSELAEAKATLESLQQETLEVTKVEKPEGNEEDISTALRAYKHQLEHAEQFSEGKCETCGQLVKIKDPTILKKRVRLLSAQLQQHKEYREYTVIRKQQRELRVKLDTTGVILKEKKALASSLSGWNTIHEQLANLPRKPKPFEGKKLQIVVLKRMLEEIQERRQLLEFCRPHLETIVAFTKLKTQDIEAAKASDGLHARMNNIQELLSKTQAKLEVHRTIAERQAETRERLVELKTQLKDEEPLRHLVNGYQDKNLKKMAVQAISTRLMQLINKYSRVVFPEDYTFSFEWGSQISLLVHRKYGKRVLTSDVRKLSGAESKLFTIILVLALLAFVPAHKRCSLLILDEPSANLSREMTQALNDLIPVLLTLIPSVVLITPKEEIYDGAKPYTVVKKNGLSTIVEGFPASVK
jgi:DNA repair exonuclease SbcCD ATPase subunit